MTVCVSILLLPRKFGSPLWLAMMAWLPTVSVDVMNVACPLSSSEAVPTVVAPSLKVTVPVGVPPLPLTVTAKLTGWPYVLGFGVEDDVMLAAAGATFWVSVVPLLENSNGSAGT